MMFTGLAQWWKLFFFLWSFVVLQLALHQLHRTTTVGRTASNSFLALKQACTSSTRLPECRKLPSRAFMTIKQSCTELHGTSNSSLLKQLYCPFPALKQDSMSYRRLPQWLQQHSRSFVGLIFSPSWVSHHLHCGENCFLDYLGT